MADLELPSVETLRNLLKCDAATGSLVWRERADEMFNPGNTTQAHRAKIWNHKHAGKPAFTYKTPKGYRYGKVNGRCKMAHRVVWAMHHGYWPKGQIDHINGNPSDNRIENLRSVSAGENTRNAKLYKTNKSGVPGVYWRKRSSNWVAQINRDGSSVCLGYFGSIDEAVIARKAAEKALGYHKNHGRTNCSDK
jgi:hypothetical protein